VSCLALAGLLVASVVAGCALANGRFYSTGSMTTARASHTAALLSDGHVLIAAGFGATISLSRCPAA
jgi:hypothetical protein